MKHFLTASAILATSVSAAAADVAVSGNGRMGVVYNGEDLNFSSRIRVAFALTGETDGGLTFGGSFRADNAGDAANGSAGEIFISGAFGTIAMGDVVGAAEAVIGDLPEIGYTDLTSQAGDIIDALGVGQNDIAYITGDSTLTSANNPVLLYTYTAGDLTFALSFNDAAAPGSTDQEYAVGVKYAFGDYAVALGYEDNGNIDHIILGVDATFGDTAVKAFWGEAADVDFTHYGVGVTHQMDALTIKGFVKKQDDGLDSVTNYGIGAAYALGGGATLEGGIVDDDLPGTSAKADLGIKFSF